MDILGSWGIPVLVVGILALATLGFALLIGKWIDAQSNNVVDDARDRKKHTRTDDRR
jgi:hypothetical protein